MTALIATCMVLLVEKVLLLCIKAHCTILPFVFSELSLGEELCVAVEALHVLVQLSS